MFEEDNTKYSWWKIYFILVLQLLFRSFLSTKMFQSQNNFCFHIFYTPSPDCPSFTPTTYPLGFSFFIVPNVLSVKNSRCQPSFFIFWFSLLMYSRTAVLFHAVDRQTKKVVDKNVVIEWADPIVDHFILNCFCYLSLYYCRTVFNKARFLGKLPSSSLGWTKISFYFAAK